MLSTSGAHYAAQKVVYAKEIERVEQVLLDARTALVLLKAFDNVTI